MKSLYESILDDEDILTSRIKRDVTDLSNILHSLFNSTDEVILEQIESGILDDFVENKLCLNLNQVKILYSKNGANKKITIYSKHIAILIIRYIPTLKQIIIEIRKRKYSNGLFTETIYKKLLVFLHTEIKNSNLLSVSSLLLSNELSFPAISINSSLILDILSFSDGIELIHLHSKS